jgi:hypothetical protein
LSGFSSNSSEQTMQTLIGKAMPYDTTFGRRRHPPGAHGISLVRLKRSL